ncbi:2'-5' RNA ligase family protein [Lentisphaerota bacterium WC36G]|nr:2'-5' RNA ligase family protein [Lentisphaerae bacterium WC36]
MFKNPTYIVFDVNGKIADKIRFIRQQLDPERADLNIEISVSGSNGLGFIKPSQNFDIIRHELDNICQQISPFWCNFGKIKKFVNTEIYYLSIKNKQPFFEVIELLKNSRIEFLPTPFEYEPHCTLTLPNTNTVTCIKGQEQYISSIKIPEERFLVTSLALYEEIKPSTFTTIFRKKLGLR